MRFSLLLAALLGWAAVGREAFAGEEKPRRMVVGDETLYVSRTLKKQVVALVRRSDWSRAFKGQEGDWKEATRFRRLPGGGASDDKLHIGRKPLSEHGALWLVRFSQDLSGPPASRPALAMNDSDDGFRVSVERLGAHVESHVLAATKLPGGLTLEVVAELVESKRHVPFEVLTWKGARRGKLPPTGRFVVRDGRGTVVVQGDLRALWRRARSTDGRWTSRTLGLRLGELQQLLVDLTTS